MIINFKKWLFEESTIAQELKKNKPSEEVQKKANEVYEKIFTFLNDKKKEKEIKDWITVKITPLIQHPSGYTDNYLVDNFSGSLYRCRDFLASKYETLNFKDANYKIEDVEKGSEKWHEELSKSKSIGSKGAWGKPIVKFANGWSWVSLEKGYCGLEGATMGHCGNVAGNSDTRHNILSLRNEKNVPQLTFIDNGGGVLGEMKGRMNKKPDRMYHEYIVGLLLNKTYPINKIIGGGMQNENNFNLNDLSPEEKHEVLSKKPNLLPTLKDFIDRKYDLQDDAFVECLVRDNLIDNCGNFKRNLENYDYDYSEKQKKVIFKPLSDTEQEQEDIIDMMDSRYDNVLRKHGYNLTIQIILTSTTRPISECLLNKIKTPHGRSSDGAHSYCNIMSIFHDRYRKIFLKMFYDLIPAMKSVVIMYFVDINKRFDDNFLKYLDIHALNLINQHDLDQTKKIRNPKLKEIIEKEIRFPYLLDKERNMGKLSEPNSYNTQYKNTDQMINNEIIADIKNTLTKIFNNEELTDEENKILKYSITVKKKTIIDLCSLFKNIKYDELITVNSIFSFIYYKEFYTNSLEDVIAFLHEFLSKIKKLTQETKMIVTKCLDSLVKKRSRYQNNWHDRELESLRQQIRDSWN